MNIRPFLPYLPTPIDAAITRIIGKETLGLPSAVKYNNEYRKIIEGILAAAGYYLACKHAGRAGLDLTKVALLGAVPLPYVTKLSISGHFVYKGVTDAIAASAKGDWASVAKSAALATFAYFATTQKYSQIVQAGYKMIGA